MAAIRIKLIPISLAVPGMVLKREVRDSHGQILLSADVALSESSISSLKRRDIGHISVAQKDERSEAELAAERIKVVERINSLFRNVSQDGSMSSLRQMILEYRMEKLSS